MYFLLFSKKGVRMDSKVCEELRQGLCEIRRCVRLNKLASVFRFGQVVCKASFGRASHVENRLT